MSGFRSYMGWSNIPDIDSATTGSDDNPFFRHKTVTPKRFLYKCLLKEWLCKKLSKLNVTLVEGYPSRSSEAGGLMMDQFLRPAKSESKWYGLSSDRKADPSAVSTWYTDPCKLNSSYSRNLQAVWPHFYPSDFQTYFTGNTQKVGQVCQLSSATRLQALIDVFSKCSRICRSNLKLYELRLKERALLKCQLPWMNYSI